MKRQSVVVILLLLLAASASAKDYEAATLVSWETVSTGENCNTGILAGVHCKELSAPLYTIRIGERTLKIQVKWAITSAKDQLHGLQPGAEFKARIDERGDLWIPYVARNGKTVEEEYSIRANQ